MKKNSKIQTIVIALIIGAMAALSLVACKPNEPPHEHKFGEWVCDSADSVYCEYRSYSRDCECGEIQNNYGSEADHDYNLVRIHPSCEAAGYDMKTCKKCGKTEIINVIPVAHALNQEFYFDSASHWQGCETCDYMTETSSHTLNDSGLCTVCEQQLTYTEGLAFELSESGDYYVVAYYEGAEQDVVIPSIYKDKLVSEIGEYAFAEFADLKSITMPDHLTSIGDCAFSGCSSLESITLPGSVTNIGISAFSGCSGLDKVYITDIVAWCNISFKNSSANPLFNGANLYLSNRLVIDLRIPSSVTSIGDCVFSGCSSLESVTIPDGVTSIGDHAFSGCSSLESVTIPASVTNIGEYAFLDCISLERVYITDIVAWCSISFENFSSNPLCNGANFYLSNLN